MSVGTWNIETKEALSGFGPKTIAMKINITSTNYCTKETGRVTTIGNVEKNGGQLKSPSRASTKRLSAYTPGKKIKSKKGGTIHKRNGDDKVKYEPAVNNAVYRSLM